MKYVKIMPAVVHDESICSGNRVYFESGQQDQDYATLIDYAHYYGMSEGTLQGVQLGLQVVQLPEQRLAPGLVLPAHPAICDSPSQDDGYYHAQYSQTRYRGRSS